MELLMTQLTGGGGGKASAGSDDEGVWGAVQGGRGAIVGRGLVGLCALAPAYNWTVPRGGRRRRRRRPAAAEGLFI